MNSPSKGSHQRGAALMVVLILLLVMTLLALASLRGTLMEERMSASQFDRSIAFQAAEAALREAEEWAETKPAPPGSGCSDGICAAPDPADATERERWRNAGFWDDASGNWRQASDIDADGLAGAPRYIVEFMSADIQDASSCTTSIDVSLEANCSIKSSRYRITVRSQEAGRAEVFLQSIYAVP